MNFNFKSSVLLIAAFAAMAGCGNDKKPAAVTVTAPKPPVVMDPFRFHKMIEVSPGQDYDVLSWGRGSKTAGAFEILHSDSAAARFTTTTGDLEGAIVDAYNSDMDLDGNPEIIIQTKGKDSTHYTTVFAFEFGSKANQLDFPKLTKSQREGYKGQDNFYIKEGVLYRQFPVFTSDSANAKPTGEKRLLQYGLRNNSFTVKTISSDTTTVNKPKKEVVKEPVQEKKSERKVSSNGGKKKKAESRKKKRRRHRSDD